MVQIKMGNRMHRIHTAAEIARLRRNQANNSSVSAETSVKLVQSTLYSTSEPGTLLSFASFSTNELPEEVRTGLAIVKSSVSISSSTPHTLSFKCICNSPASATVFFFAKELIDGKTKSMYFSLHPKGPKQTGVDLTPGEQEVSIKTSINFENFTESELNFSDRITFPLIILLKSEKEMLITYYKFLDKALVKVRENYSVNNRSYEVKDVPEYKCENCVICNEKESQVQFYSCGHISSCKECFGNIWKGNRKCPMCRSYIFGWCNKFG